MPTLLTLKLLTRVKGFTFQTCFINSSYLVAMALYQLRSCVKLVYLRSRYFTFPFRFSFTRQNRQNFFKLYCLNVVAALL